jgi:UDP-N-acetylmuramyl pentapeptide phosphotransferase/UDP-N-acetylglucosamine-1-phosphate transferase
MPFEAVIKYPSIFFVALLATLLLTPMWRRLAPALGFMDTPGGRKIHKNPVPVGGGIAIFIGFHAACAAVFLLPWKPFAGQIEIDWWFRFIPLSFGVLALGLFDDRFGVNPAVKLTGQTLLALSAYGLNIRLQNVLGIAMPAWVDLVATILWFLAIMNAFNLIDGIDGLASGIALIAAVGIGISLIFRQSPGDVLLFAGFAGACLGFLRYNYYPASVFLGDTGSLFIGFTLAALTISTNSKGSAVAAIGMPLLAVGVPLFDTLLAVWRRVVRRLLHKIGVDGKLANIDRGDADHLHHRLLRQGRKHDQVAWLLYGVTALLAATGILTTVFNDRILGILGLGFVIAAYTIVRHLAWIELRDTGEVVLLGISKPIRRNLTLFFYIISDIVILNLAWLATVLLMDLQDGALQLNLKAAWLRAVPVDVVIPFLILLFSRSYSRTWSMARISEYIGAGAAVVTGGAAACAVSLLSQPADGSVWQTVLHYVVLTGLAAPCIVGTRASVRVIQDLMQWAESGSAATDLSGTRTLVWGSGYRTMLYLRQNTLQPERKNGIRVVGIISADDALRGHSVHGVRVLGNAHDLPALVKEKNIQALCLVEEVGEQQLAGIRRMLCGLPVRLIQWRIAEEELDVPGGQQNG